MSGWNDYQTSLNSLASLGGDLQRRLDDADRTFSRSADDLARGRKDADAKWSGIETRAQEAKSTARILAARVGISVDTHHESIQVDQHNVEYLVRDMERTSQWCHQAVEWLTRHQDRLAQYRRQQEEAATAQQRMVVPTQAPTPVVKAGSSSSKLPIILGVTAAVVVGLVILLVVML